MQRKLDNLGFINKQCENLILKKIERGKFVQHSLYEIVLL